MTGLQSLLLLLKQEGSCMSPIVFHCNDGCALHRLCGLEITKYAHHERLDIVKAYLARYTEEELFEELL